MSHEDAELEFREARTKLDDIIGRLCAKHGIPLAIGKPYHFETNRYRGLAVFEETAGMNYHLYDFSTNLVFMIYLSPPERSHGPPMFDKFPHFRIWPRDNDHSLVTNCDAYDDILPIGMDSLRYEVDAVSISMLERLLDRLMTRATQIVQRSYAARTIQKAYSRAIENPKFHMCVLRLQREFEELSDL
jgi:hypothetical protein